MNLRRIALAVLLSIFPGAQALATDVTHGSNTITQIRNSGTIVPGIAKLNLLGAGVTAVRNGSQRDMLDLTFSGGGGTVFADSPLTGNGSSGSHLGLTTSPAGQTPVGVTRLVSSGTGLSGGGDLSADRTLSVAASQTSITSIAPAGALTLTCGAACTWSSSAGNLAVDSASALNLGATNATSIGIGRSGITTTLTGGFTYQTGVFSMTGNGASTITTSSGNTTIDSAAALNLGNTNATSLAVGRSGITTTLTGGFTQQTGVFSMTGNGASTITTSSSNLIVDAFATLNLGTSAATQVNIARASQATQVNGRITAAQDVYFTGVNTPTAIGGNTDNYNPAGLGTTTTLRQDVSGAFNLTGITAPLTGRYILFCNISTANTLTLIHDATSTAANRFFLPNSANLAVRPNGCVTLNYDNTSSRWRVVGNAAWLDRKFETWRNAEMRVA